MNINSTSGKILAHKIDLKEFSPFIPSCHHSNDKNLILDNLYIGKYTNFESKFSIELETIVFFRCYFDNSILGNLFATYDETNEPVFSKLKKIIVIDSVIIDEDSNLRLSNDDFNFYSSHAKNRKVELICDYY